MNDASRNALLPSSVNRETYTMLIVFFEDDILFRLEPLENSTLWYGNESRYCMYSPYS